MKKVKRSERIIDMTQYLLTHPHTRISLTAFAERYDAAKSSISEDFAIIKEVFESGGYGQLITLPGAAGGVKYIPLVPREKARAQIEEICRELSQPERLLPGGYLYMSDLLGQPMVLNGIGRLFASIFSARDFDVIMTVETKGIPLAHAAAMYLNVPVVVVRRDNKVTEGSAVSINYVSGSSKRIQTMSLARRALPERTKVLIIDDFMKAGGTIRGMMDLLQEFNAEVAGVGVFVESRENGAEAPLIEQYVSLAKLTKVDTVSRTIRVEPGNYFAVR